MYTYISGDIQLNNNIVGVLGRPCKEHDDLCAAAANNNNFLGFTLGKMKIISCFYRKEIVSLISNLFHVYTITSIFPFLYFKINYCS